MFSDSNGLQITGIDYQTQDAIIERLGAIEEKMHAMSTQLERIVAGSVTSSSLSFAARTGTGVFGPEQRPPKRQRVIVSPDVQANTERHEAFSPGSERLDISEDILSSIIDAYFIFAHNQPYSFFHERTFRRRLARHELADHLVLAVAAFGLRFCQHHQLPADTHEMAVNAANQSWKSVVSNCFGTSKAIDVSIVQTIALLALFDFTAGKSRHGAAWVKIGMAVRIAQDLGLMLEPAGELSPADQEERRRIFWSVYLLDRLVSCGRGRPPAIVDACCQLQLPCEEQSWRNGVSQHTMTLDDFANRTSGERTLSGGFARVVVLAYIVGRVAQYMLQEFNIRSRYPPWDPSSDYAAIEADLLHLESRLELDKTLAETLAPHVLPTGAADHQITGPLVFSKALFHLSYCMLAHPFLLRRRLGIGQLQAPSSFLGRTFDTAWRHAQKLMALFREAAAHMCAFRSSFSGYCVLVAGSIAALYTFNEDVSVCTKASALLQEAIVYLQDTGQYWRNVSTMASKLQQTADTNLVFSQLATDRPQIAPLAQDHINAMWSLVDYSTISNEALINLSANQLPAMDMWSESWMDLFGTQFNVESNDPMGSVLDSMNFYPSR